jgi:hypothetical protein
VTATQTRVLSRLPGAIVVVLACLGFFVHGLHEWARVLMFVAIVGVAAWGNGAQTQAGAPAPAQPAPGAAEPMNADFPVDQKLAD